MLVGDGPEKARIRQRVDDERLGNVLLLDPIPKSEIPDLLAAADIGVHCLADVDLFRTGVSPNKLYDYMAAGRPVITNTPGEVAEFVIESGGGFAVPPDGLSTGLGSLAEMSADERAELGNCGRVHLAAQRSRTAMALRIEGLLDAVVDEGST